MTPAGGKQVIGAATFQGTTNVDSDKHTVVISGIKVIHTYFPTLDEAASGKMDQLFRTFVPEVVRHLHSNGSWPIYLSPKPSRR